MSSILDLRYDLEDELGISGVKAHKVIAEAQLKDMREYLRWGDPTWILSRYEVSRKAGLSRRLRALVNRPSIPTWFKVSDAKMILGIEHRLTIIMILEEAIKEKHPVARWVRTPSHTRPDYIGPNPAVVTRLAPPEQADDGVLVMSMGDIEKHFGTHHTLPRECFSESHA